MLGYSEDTPLNLKLKEVINLDENFDIECVQYMALESTVLCDPEDYGLPEDKKYPMPDKKHVLLAIKFFNATDDPDKQKILAANINKRIKDFNMESEVNVGDKNNFKKFWKPSTEAVITSVAPIVPYQQPALKKAESIDDPLLIQFPVKKKKNAPLVATESNLKSEIDPDYKPKGNLSLSKFKKVKVTEITKEMKESPITFFKHIDAKRDTTYVWYDGQDIVGVGSVRHAITDAANYNWITAIQVNPKYKGYGLGKQILDFCVKKLNGDALTVAIDNNIAFEMYKKYGFKVSKESLEDVKAGRRKVYFMYKKDVNLVANESMIFSQKDYMQNLDKWKPGPNNILYITGLSGSGKSTLAKDYAKKYNAHIFELDGLQHNFDSSGKGILEKCKKDIPEYANAVKTFLKEKNDGEFTNDEFNLMKRVAKHVIQLCKEDSETLYIIEGIQLFRWFNRDQFKSKPLIIKGTSMLASSIRGNKRDFTENGKLNKVGMIKTLPQRLKWESEDEKSLNQFKKEMSLKEFNIGTEGIIDIKSPNYQENKR